MHDELGNEVMRAEPLILILVILKNLKKKKKKNENGFAEEGDDDEKEGVAEAQDEHNDGTDGVTPIPSRESRRDGADSVAPRTTPTRGTGCYVLPCDYSEEMLLSFC